MTRKIITWGLLVAAAVCLLAWPASYACPGTLHIFDDGKSPACEVESISSGSTCAFRSPLYGVQVAQGNLLLYRLHFEQIQECTPHVRHSLQLAGFEWQSDTTPPSAKTSWHVRFPLGLSALLAAAYPAPALLTSTRKRREGMCKHCGYDLRGSPSGRCPECGRDAAPLAPPPNKACEIALPVSA